MTNNYKIRINGQTYLVEILGDPNQPSVQVRINDQVITAEIESAVSPQVAETPVKIESESTKAPAAPSQSAPVQTQSDGSYVAAPLPGTIVTLMVAPGSEVQTGDDLVVLEAMKMKNRIRSPRNGTIKEVLVQVGDQVAHGTVLLTWND